MIHKARTLSARNDTAPDGLRSTACWQELPGIEVIGGWSKVTCEDCLTQRIKNNKPKIHLEGLQCGRAGFYTRAETKLKDMVTCLRCRRKM